MGQEGFNMQGETSRERACRAEARIKKANWKDRKEIALVIAVIIAVGTFVFYPEYLLSLMGIALLAGLGFVFFIEIAPFIGVLIFLLSLMCGLAAESKEVKQGCIVGVIVGLVWLSHAAAIKFGFLGPQQYLID